MATHSIDESTAPAPQQSVEVQGAALHGILSGLIPLGLLASVVLIAHVATALARELTTGGGFYVQQQAALITLIVGLVLAIVVFAIACWRVLHQVGLWQKAGVAVEILIGCNKGRLECRMHSNIPLLQPISISTATPAFCQRPT